MCVCVPKCSFGTKSTATVSVEFWDPWVLRHTQYYGYDYTMTICDYTSIDTIYDAILWLWLLYCLRLPWGAMGLDWILHHFFHSTPSKSLA